MFAKIAAFDYTAEWLRREFSAYQALARESFIPYVLGWHDDGQHPTLVIEDLSDARWPPPWDGSLIDGVLASLDKLRSCSPPGSALDMAMWRTKLTSWPTIAEEAAAVLSLGLCTARWLDRALSVMIGAEAAAPLDGTEALHMDVRSDNLCFRDGHVQLVDWNWLSLGNAAFDVATWLPSLEAEGGPAPEDVVPDVNPGFAAITAGYHLRQATLPDIPQAPHVRDPQLRDLQLRQARSALPWAARLLELPPPRGST